jgi:cyanide hydratase
MAPNVTKKYKAAAVNAEPGWLDLELSVEKTIHWINEAGKNGCKLVAFPELCKSMRARSPSPLHTPPAVLAHLFELLGTLITLAD